MIRTRSQEESAKTGKKNQPTVWEENSASKRGSTQIRKDTRKLQRHRMGRKKRSKSKTNQNFKKKADTTRKKRKYRQMLIVRENSSSIRRKERQIAANRDERKETDRGGASKRSPTSSRRRKTTKREKRIRSGSFSKRKSNFPLTWAHQKKREKWGYNIEEETQEGR